MKKQPDFVITVKEEVYGDAPGQIFTASGIYVALVGVAVGFWIWHDYKDQIRSCLLLKNKLVTGGKTYCLKVEDLYLLVMVILRSHF